MTMPRALCRAYSKIRDGLACIRWVLAGRPPVHVDCSLTDISVPYTTSTMSKAEQETLMAEWADELGKPKVTV